MIDYLSWYDINEGIGRSQIFGYDVIVADRDIIDSEYSVFYGL